MESRQHLLDGFPVVVTVPILWGDEDSFGHVNNVVYLRWAETARVEYLTRVGLWRMIREEGIGPIVAALSCDYRRPLEYPDEVRIGAHVTSIGNTSFKMAHRIVGVRHGLLAAEVNSALVVLDYKTKKPVRVPDPIRKAIQEIEGKVFA
jgi:acyl-CoA thioester hydrolase